MVDHVGARLLQANGDVQSGQGMGCLGRPHGGGVSGTAGDERSLFDTSRNHDQDCGVAQFREAATSDLVTLLGAATRSVSAAVLAEIDPTGQSGVRLAHVPVIAALDAGGPRISDLAPAVGITRQGTSALVRDLEKVGIVVTAPDPQDRRATIVRLTDAGLDFCHRALRTLARREATLAETLGEERLSSLKATLRELASPGA